MRLSVAGGQPGIHSVVPFQLFAAKLAIAVVGPVLLQKSLVAFVSHKVRLNELSQAVYFDIGCGVGLKHPASVCQLRLLPAGCCEALSACSTIPPRCGCYPRTLNSLVSLVPQRAPAAIAPSQRFHQAALASQGPVEISAVPIATGLGTALLLIGMRLHTACK